MSVNKMPVTITGTGDSRNIIVRSSEDPSNIELEIRGDSHNPSDYQWFNFDFEGVLYQDYVLRIKNASGVRFPGWNAYDVPFQTSASYDGITWFHMPTHYDEESGELVMRLHMEQPKIQLAFFPPYTYEKHLALIAFAGAELTVPDIQDIVPVLSETEGATSAVTEQPKVHPTWQVTRLGKTNGEEGRDISLITIGEPSPQKKNVWVIARQHPGEPQAEWYMDGLIRHLKTSMSSNADLFENAVFYLVPNMNPDGTFDGNLRTNGKGKDLNRMWQTATIEDSPEVYYVLEAMKRFGVDFFIDVHSDEEIPRAFLDLGHLNCLTVDDAVEALETTFLTSYLENPDMQDVLKYPQKERQPSNLDLASAYVSEHFKCPAFTLEMPTKEWSWDRSQSLGVDLLRVMRHMLPLVPKLSIALNPAQGVRNPGSNSVFESIRRTLKIENPVAAQKDQNAGAAQAPRMGGGCDTVS